MKNQRHLLAISFFFAACGSTDELPRSNGQGPAPFDPDQQYSPQVEANKLSAEIAHPLFPAPVGARWIYQAESNGEIERVEVTVETATRAVWGAEARVVRDTVTIDGALVEDTWDWYAQDPSGHVWYLGEETYEYENGAVKCSCGAWESGVGGALPGVIMLAQPKVGDVYRQEYSAGIAEDLAEVVATGEQVTVPAGTFDGCVKTRDLSAIDPNIDSFKYYCPEVGFALELEGDVRVELIEYSGL